MDFPVFMMKTGSDGIHVAGKDFEVTIDRTKGLTSWRSHGLEMINTPLRPSFWRANGQ